MTQTIPIPIDLLQAILDYLQGKPYCEVNKLIGGIGQAAQQAQAARQQDQPFPTVPTATE